ncbi:MAG TPA: STAS domain-containing protein [Cyclobacteriaceae bacterium]|nr:STAS domain-containing protein [Cyclobacteriaceae bacterium]
MVNISSVKENGVLVLLIGGEIDASSSIHLDNELGQAINSHKKILIDCSKLEYISSAGLGVFMSYIHDMEEKKIKMVLFGMSNKVQNVFQILGLDQLLKIVDSREEAKNLLNAI